MRLTRLSKTTNDYEDNPAQLLANASDINVVQQVLSGLPERQQQAFCYVRGRLRYSKQQHRLWLVAKAVLKPIIVAH